MVFVSPVRVMKSSGLRSFFSFAESLAAPAAASVLSADFFCLVPEVPSAGFSGFVPEVPSAGFSFCFISPSSTVMVEEVREVIFPT